MIHKDTSAFSDVLVGPVDPQIIELEAALRAAQLAADEEALDRLISDELLFAGPSGRLATKAEDLEAHRSGTVRVREHEPLELRIRRVGREVGAHFATPGFGRKRKARGASSGDTWRPSAHRRLRKANDSVARED